MSFTEISHSLWKAVAVAIVVCLLSAQTESAAFSEVESKCLAVVMVMVNVQFSRSL